MTSKLGRRAFLFALSTGVASLLATLKLVYSDDPVGVTLKVTTSTFFVSIAGIAVGVTMLLTAAAKEALAVRSVRRSRRW